MAASDLNYSSYAEKRSAPRSDGEVGLLLGLRKRRSVYDLGLVLDRTSD